MLIRLCLLHQARSSMRDSLLSACQAVCQLSAVLYSQGTADSRVRLVCNRTSSRCARSARWFWTGWFTDNKTKYKTNHSQIHIKPPFIYG